MKEWFENFSYQKNYMRIMSLIQNPVSNNTHIQGKFGVNGLEKMFDDFKEENQLFGVKKRVHIDNHSC